MGLLLGRGADIENTSRLGRTTIQATADDGYYKKVILRKRHNSNFKSKDLEKKGLEVVGTVKTVHEGGTLTLGTSHLNKEAEATFLLHFRALSALGVFWSTYEFVQCTIIHVRGLR